MKRPSRVLWLPAVAVLLPCGFIAVLGAAWLRLEREAAAHRGLQAADATVAGLRRDVEHELRAIADTMTPGLTDRPLPRPPFEAPPSCPDLCSEILLVDEALPPEADDEPRETIAGDADREARAAAHGAAVAAVEELERRGRITLALAAAEDLLRKSDEPAPRASVLLVLARLSTRAGRTSDLERYARAMVDCCAAERDEFGMSFVLYTAWQRLSRYDIARDPPDVRLAALVTELDDLVTRGYLGAESDVTTIALAGARAQHRGGFSDLVARVTARHARIQSRASLARAVSGWMGQIDPRSLSDTVLVRTIGHGASATPAALTAVGTGTVVVMPLDRAKLEVWIARWARGRGAFDLTLQRPGEARAPEGALPLPLFPEARDLALTLVPRGPDPAADSRTRLLAIAVAGVFVLTFVVALLAGRDVLREIRTASTRSAFVTSVTHELKTPLTAIRLLTETLRQNRARPEARDELLDTMTEEAERLSRLVDNVLSSSRIESGTQQYRPRIVSLADATRRALRQVAPVLQKEGFEVAERVEQEPMPVHADPDALNQVVLNLVGNAMKYSSESRHIEVCVTRQDGQATLAIADRGIGIALMDQARVFDRFYRTKEAAAHTTGAGLGLALVRHFAEAHGGRVQVDSAPGRGSVFSLSLPIAPEGS